MAEKTERTNVMSPEAMLAFHSLFTARAIEEGKEPSHNATLVFTPEAQQTPEFAAMKAAAQQAAVAKWGNAIPSGLRNPFRPCSEKPSYFGDLPEGSVYINASTKQRPGVVKAQGNGVVKILDENEVYPGCFVRATLSPYAYDQKGNKGVSFGLGNVLKVKDGERRGGRPRAEDEFAGVVKAAPGAGGGAAAESLF